MIGTRCGTMALMDEHGGWATSGGWVQADLGVLQARRLDHLTGHLGVSARAILLAWIEEHDADGAALRDAAGSIVLDAESDPDPLDADAAAIVAEARRVLAREKPDTGVPFTAALDWMVRAFVGSVTSGKGDEYTGGYSYRIDIAKVDGTAEPYVYRSDDPRGPDN